jgi:multiple sugar transport system ATP-binding protein
MSTDHGLASFEEASMGRIVLEHVSKEFPGGVQAVRDVSLEISNGEFMVLVGPSGCGKTTILRMIAGLEEVTDGEVIISDRVVTDEKPKDRDIAMVFQNYALYPHMNVEQNIGFGMRLRRKPKPEVKRRVGDAAQALALLDYLTRRPADLSGGQRQRVAIGRAMVREPQAFLMDEPLSNLDAKLRVQMRAELARLHKQLGTTIVYVTHDQVEAMTLGDRVAVLCDGVLQQVDTPQKLFRDPANLFVAGFIGSPAMNLVEATVAGDELRFGSHRLPLPPDGKLDAHKGRPVILGIRPSDFEDAEVWRDQRLPVMEVVADVVEDLGSEAHVLFTVDAPPVLVEGVAEDPEAGAPIPLVAAEGRSVFTAAVDARSAARPGRGVRLSVHPDRFHFFDRETGEVIRAEQRPVADADSEPAPAAGSAYGATGGGR